MQRTNSRYISASFTCLRKATEYGYKKIGLILDIGNFSRENIEYMDKCNYDFIIIGQGYDATCK